MTNLKGLAGRDWNPGVSRRVPALMRDCRGPGASGAIMNGCSEASQEIVFENGENVVKGGGGSQVSVEGYLAHYSDFRNERRIWDDICDGKTSKVHFRGNEFRVRS